MGLDIYLKRFEDFTEAQRLEGMYHEQSEKYWNFDGKNYDDLTEGEREQARAQCKAYAESLGLDEDGEYKHKQYIQRDSAKYPEHYFKIGYCRSSYNSTGINRVLEQSLGITLHDIFGTDGKEYYVNPDWTATKTRVHDATSKFRAYIEHSPYQAMKASFTPWKLPECDSERKAIEVYIEESTKRKRPRQDWTGWKNLKGQFWVNDTLLVVAVIPGVKERLFSSEKEP